MRIKKYNGSSFFSATVEDYREHQTKTFKREIKARRFWQRFTASKFFYPLALATALIRYPLKNPKRMSAFATIIPLALATQHFA